MPAVRMYGLLLFAIVFLVFGALRGVRGSKEVVVASSKEVVAVPEPAPVLSPAVPEPPTAPSLVQEEGEIAQPTSSDVNYDDWFRDSSDGYTDWQEFDWHLAMLEYEMEDMKKALNEPETSPEQRLEFEKYLDKLKTDQVTMFDLYAKRKAEEPSDRERYGDWEEEREQFDFGESVADW